MQSTFGEAFHHAWGVLTGVIDEGSARTIRALFFLLFIGGIAWSVYSYLQLMMLREEKTFSPNQSASTLAQDKKRLDTMISQVKAVSDKRRSSFQWSDNMKALNKYPFDDPLARRPDIEEMKAEVPETPVTPAETIVEPPPGLVVKAILAESRNKTAVMDIPGVGSGLVVRQGNTFMNGKGRIIRITDEKVTLRWDGNTWNIAPGF